MEAMEAIETGRCGDCQHDALVDHDEHVAGERGVARFVPGEPVMCAARMS